MPAQKFPPLPVSTAADNSLSLSSSSTALASPWLSARLTALRDSGRLMVMINVRPRRSRSIFVRHPFFFDVAPRTACGRECGCGEHSFHEVVDFGGVKACKILCACQLCEFGFAGWHLSRRRVPQWSAPWPEISPRILWASQRPLEAIFRWYVAVGAAICNILPCVAVVPVIFANDHAGVDLPARSYCAGNELASREARRDPHEP